MKILVVFFSSIFLSLTIFAKTPEIEWSKCYGSIDNDRLYSIMSTPDSGCIIAGIITSNGGDVTKSYSGTDIWIAKLNKTGDLEWQKTYGGTKSDYLYQIKACPTGGYIFAASTISNDKDVSGNHGNNDAWVVKIDSLGAIEWQKCFGGSNDDMAKSVDITNNGDFIIGGETASNDGDVTNNHGGTRDAWILKLDPQGNILWQKSIGGSGNDFLMDIVALPNNNIIAVGQTNSTDGDLKDIETFGSDDILAINLTQGGDINWIVSLGGSDKEYGTSVVPVDDGYMIGGYTLSKNGYVAESIGGGDFWLIKLDLNGDFVWQKCYGGSNSDYLNKICQTSDGGFLFSGYTNSKDIVANHGNADLIIFKINSTGIVEWKQCYGDAGDEKYGYFTLLSDGSLFLGGTTSSVPGSVVGVKKGADDFWIAKLSQISDVIHESVSLQEFAIYPNPNNGIFTIESNNTWSSGEIKVFDILGNIVWNGVSTGDRTQVNISSFPTGMYFVQVGDKTQLIIKE